MGLRVILMKLFQCQACQQIIYFENTRCERCGHTLGFSPTSEAIYALDPVDGRWRSIVDPPQRYRFCENAQHKSCNWLIEDTSPEFLCVACKHNRTIPDLTIETNINRWQRIETEKHRLFYSLLKHRLPLKTRAEDAEHGLAFDFLAAGGSAAGPKILTGHDNGLITIALEEADDVERERRRVNLHEPYRSLLGHFRHEIGHYYWDVLIKDQPGTLASYRAMFGDETRDYGSALQVYYQSGPPANWQDRFISAYAASHPWEDWAETWAHYLHIVDTLEMASAFSIRVRPRVQAESTLSSTINLNPYGVDNFQMIIDDWLPLSFAMNSLNRAMGHMDLYPFVLSPAVIEKLGFVHSTIRSGREIRGPG